MQEKKVCLVCCNLRPITDFRERKGRQRAARDTMCTPCVEQATAALLAKGYPEEKQCRDCRRRFPLSEFVVAGRRHEPRCDSCRYTHKLVTRGTTIPAEARERAGKRFDYYGAAHDALYPGRDYHALSRRERHHVYLDAIERMRADGMWPILNASESPEEEACRLASLRRWYGAPPSGRTSERRTCAPMQPTTTTTTTTT